MGKTKRYVPPTVKNSFLRADISENELSDRQSRRHAALVQRNKTNKRSNNSQNMNGYEYS